MHVGDKELKSLLKSISQLCHKNLPTIYEAAMQVGFVRGISPLFFFMHLHEFLQKHTHAYTYTKGEYLVESYPRQVLEQGWNKISALED